MDATEFRVALVRLGLRNRDIAREASLTRETISRYANGKKPVPPLLARYLKLRLKCLTHGSARDP